MSFQITEAFKRDFESNVYHLAQAKQDLSQYARQGTMNAEGKFIDRVGTVSMRERTDRHSRVVYSETPHSRRYVTPQEFYASDLVDKADKLQVLQDPASEYLIEFVNAMKRQKTEVFLTAALGVAKTGKLGDGTAAFDTNNEDTAAGAFSFAKVNATRRKMKNDDIEFEDESPHFAVTPDALEDLYNEGVTGNTGGTRTHADYMTIRQIQNGEMSGMAWQGFVWHETTLTPLRTGSSTIHECVAWCPSGMAMVFNNDGESTVDRIPELHNSWQVYISFMGGAVRLEEAKVHQVDVTNN